MSTPPAPWASPASPASPVSPASSASSAPSGPAVTPAGGQAVQERPQERIQAQTPWTVIVWDDPVTLMSYVTHVFRTYFKFPRDKAEQLMLQVHNEGRAAVASGERDAMERHVIALHGYGLMSTLEHD